MRFAGLLTVVLILAGCRSSLRSTIDWNLQRLKPHVAEEPACQLSPDAITVRTAVGQDGGGSRRRSGRQQVRGFLAPFVMGCDDEECVDDPCCNNCDVAWVLADGPDRRPPAIELHVNEDDTAFTGVVSECEAERFLEALKGRLAVATGHLQTWAPEDVGGMAGSLSVKSVCLAKD